MRFYLRTAVSLALLIGVVGECRSETVDVKYRGPVDLAPFRCTSVVIDKSTVDAFNAAESMGRFFNASIKGHFDCRTGHVPSYIP